MATLKGQNLRVLVYMGSTLECIGMATNCTITETNNTEDLNTKDDINLASKPTTTNKTWQVQVESLNVANVDVLVGYVQGFNKVTLMWDETSTLNNQAREKATFARKGQAYLSDFTVNFNDRENSVKNLTFSGTGSLEAVGSSEEATVLAAGSYTKGQYVRLFLSNDNTAAAAAVIAAAKQLAFHCSLALEEASTKDTDGDWTIQEPTLFSYDITTQALVRGGDTITSQVDGQALSDIQTIYDNGTPVKWEIANVSGDNNRTKGASIFSGSALLTQLQINAQNRQNATYQATLNGYGALVIAH